MTDVASVAVELDVLETIQAALAAIAIRTDPERRHELVQLRKRLSIQIAVIGRVCEPFFLARPDALAEFRRLYSAMRSATALHQADWPAVRLGEFDDLYRESALRARRANGIFVAWLRTQLGNKTPPGNDG